MHNVKASTGASKIAHRDRSWASSPVAIQITGEKTRPDNTLLCPSDRLGLTHPDHLCPSDKVGQTPRVLYTTHQLTHLRKKYHPKRAAGCCMLWVTVIIVQIAEAIRECDTRGM